MNPIEKRCSKCGLTKPADAFAKNRSCKDGLQSRCRGCKSQEDREVRERHPEIAVRGKQAYRARNKKKRSDYQREWRKKYPEKNRAYRVVWRALRRGELVRPAKCERCGAEGQIDAHHHDYSKPLEVEWICRRCHTTDAHEMPVPPTRQKDAD